MADMRKRDISKEYMKPIKALALLTQNKTIASLMPLQPTFNFPNSTSKTIETMTLFGTFFSKLGIFADSDPTISETYFASNDTFFSGESIGEEIDGIGMGSRNPGDV